jgi:predicted small metal-binding protein
MSLTLACGDVVDGCPAVVRAESEDELFAQAGQHAAQAHGLTEIDDQTMEALRRAVRQD